MVYLMNFDSNCNYCTKGQGLDDLMIKICDMDASILYLFKEQTYKGRVLLAYKEHGVELFQLDEKEFALYMNDIKRAAAAVNTVFKPAKINFGAYGDKMPHLHFHLVPKYVDGPTWGGVFEMNPGKVYLKDEEYANLIQQIKANL
jgi:diadenosine tetraphosphate (Ap4A) HIT family hydrolase